MPAIFYRSLNYQFGAALAGFVFGLALVAITGWATVASKPSVFFARPEHTKV